MTRTFILTFLILIGFMCVGKHAQAQNFELVDYGTNISPELEKTVLNNLEKEPEFINFKENFGNSIPMLLIGMVDLNFDKKYEVVVRILHDYHFRDKENNVQTYVFAQTSKGFIKIFDDKIGEIALQGIGSNGLKNIVGFRGLTRDYDLYVWDGQKRYIKDE